MTEVPWFQLTYTSSDQGSGAGGWGVKDVSRGIPAAIERDLVAGVTTRVPDATALPAFPSDEELAARTRRLACRGTADEEPPRVLMWHSVSAGSDATGRPGNVFTHAAACLRPPADFRPVDLWLSPDWLVPFGATGVPLARLGPLAASGSVDAGAVLDFLDEGEHAIALEWLLPAFVHCAETARTLVLVVPDDRQGALWIAVLSRLTAASLAQTLSWVTFERAQALLDEHTELWHVACVPPSEQQALLDADAEHLLVVDPAWTLDDSLQSEQAWVLPEGARLPPTPWSAAALDLLALRRPGALAALAAADEVMSGVELATSPRIAWGWPLRVGLQAGTSWGSDREESLADCLVRAPGACAGSPVLQRLMDSLVDNAATASVLAVVKNAQTSLPVRQALERLLLLSFLRRRPSDPLQVPRPSRDTVRSLSPDDHDQIGHAIERAIADAPAALPETLASIALLMECLRESGLARDDAALDELARKGAARLVALSASYDVPTRARVEQSLTPLAASSATSTVPSPPGVPFVPAPLPTDETPVSDPPPPAAQPAPRVPTAGRRPFPGTEPGSRTPGALSHPAPAASPAHPQDRESRVLTRTRFSDDVAHRSASVLLETCNALDRLIDALGTGSAGTLQGVDGLALRLDLLLHQVAPSSPVAEPRGTQPGGAEASTPDQGSTGDAASRRHAAWWVLAELDAWRSSTSALADLTAPSPSHADVDGIASGFFSLGPGRRAAVLLAAARCEAGQGGSRLAAGRPDGQTTLAWSAVTGGLRLLTGLERRSVVQQARERLDGAMPGHEPHAEDARRQVAHLLENVLASDLGPDRRTPLEGPRSWPSST